jgi:hypothetical protein
MKVAFKPFGSDKTASTRLRVFLPIRHINNRSQEITCQLFKPNKIDEYALVIFQKAYTTEDIELAIALKKRNVKIAFDLCDNHFYNPSHSEEGDERNDRLRKIIDLADAISVSNKGLGQLTERNYTLIDDMVEYSVHNSLACNLFRPFSNLAKRRKRLQLVWFGSAGSEVPRFGMIDIVKIVPELNELSRQINLELSVISNSKEKFKQYLATARFPTCYYEWRKATFPYIMQRQDITLIPIDVNPFTAYKTNNRPVFSLILGIPVVADKIESYEVLSEFIRFGNWKQNIEAYWKNPLLRSNDVASGQEFIRRRYNEEVISDQWISFIKKSIKNEFE